MHPDDQFRICRNSSVLLRWYWSRPGHGPRRKTSKVVVIWFLFPETKGLTLEEIRVVFEDISNADMK